MALQTYKSAETLEKLRKKTPFTENSKSIFIPKKTFFSQDQFTKPVAWIQYKNSSNGNYKIFKKEISDFWKLRQIQCKFPKLYIIILHGGKFCFGF